MEYNISAMQSTVDNALKANNAAEEQSENLEAELNRSKAERFKEQEKCNINTDTLRKRLENEILDLRSRLDEAESAAAIDNKRQIAKLGQLVSIEQISTQSN